MDKVFLENLGVSEQAQEAILQQHQQVLGKVQFDAMLERTVTAAGSRSVKAAVALLDTAALQQADDPAAAAQEAVNQLKKDSAWLFESQVSAPYAPGTGTGSFTAPEPKTLAEALKAKFRR